MVQGVPAIGVVVGLVVILVASFVLLALQNPPMTEITVLAATPWMLTAGLFHTLATLEAYPEQVAEFLRFPWVYLIVILIASITWAPLLQLGTLRGRARGNAYLAASGSGLALVLTVTLLVRSAVTPRVLLWLSLTPFLAGFVAAAVYVLLGLIDATTLATVRWAGYLVVFAYTFAGLAVVVTTDVYDIEIAGSVGQQLLTAARSLPVPERFGVGWMAAVTATLIGAGAAILCGRYVRVSATRGYLATLALTAAALGPASARLLLTLFG